MFKIRIAFLLLFLNSFCTSYLFCQQESSQAFPYSSMPDVFPGTKQLTWQGDLSVKMLDGAHKLIENKIAAAVEQRSNFWKRDLSGKTAYEQSVLENRKRLSSILGLEDRSKKPVSYNVGLAEQYPTPTMIKVSEIGSADVVASTSKYNIYQVRWPVFTKVNGEGLLLQPKGSSKGFIIALPDADQTPEQLAGLQNGIQPASQFARHLAENGYEVLIPVLISRKKLFAHEEKQQTYREWIYRQAYHMGKHIIGYEVQKVIAAIDWAKQKDSERKVAVAGYGEGGVIAFYAAALDTRIDAAMISGYFRNRQKVWDEPIYRNIWKQLLEFGDAEVASLVAPRGLVVEYSRAPTLRDEIEDYDRRKLQMEGLPYTGYKGQLDQPAYAEVKAEFDRIESLVGKNLQQRSLISAANGRAVDFGSFNAIKSFLQLLGDHNTNPASDETVKDSRTNLGDSARQWRQVREIEEHVQELVRDGDKTRNNNFLHKVMPDFARREWSTKPYHHYYDAKVFSGEAVKYRKYFAEEVMGTFKDSLLPFNAQTRKIIDAGRYTAYEVVLDVLPDLFATGILLVPKDMKKNERRPVVVCQHGRNDVPRKMIEGNFTIYNDAASKLADQGFVVYVPQNPYRGEDRYRWLSRKGNTIGKTLFSFIVAQHDQATRWLSTLPFVDKSRIAFYGLSYGGQTAMRVPAILDAYCLSICSGDFGDGARKVTDTHYEGSFANTIEWEMPYFNMGNTFSYAEMSYLIFPRPFMVERGHHDMVQPSEWVNYEYGKVRYFYDQFGLGDRTEMEQFNGGHTMRGEGTFRFLHKHLSWP